jgi:hypothetical protein
MTFTLLLPMLRLLVGCQVQALWRTDSPVMMTPHTTTFHPRMDEPLDQTHHPKSYRRKRSC